MSPSHHLSTSSSATSFRSTRRLPPWNSWRGYPVYFSYRVSHFSREFPFSASAYLCRSLPRSHVAFSLLLLPLKDFTFFILPGWRHDNTLLRFYSVFQKLAKVIRSSNALLFLVTRSRRVQPSFFFFSSHSHRRYHPPSMSLRRGMYSNSFLPRWTSSFDLPDLELVGISTGEGRWASFWKPMGRDSVSDPRSYVSRILDRGES